VTFEELLAQSDIIIITASFNESTRGIFFNKAAFTKMKKRPLLSTHLVVALLTNQTLLKHSRMGTLLELDWT